MTIFTIYFSLLYADKLTYVNDTNVYSVNLSKTITGKEIEHYAKKNDVIVEIMNHHNISFGKTEIDIMIFNPEEGIHGGLQNSIFPKYKINYIVDESVLDCTTQCFTVQTDDEQKLILFCNELEENDYQCDYFYTGNSKFSISMLFGKLNLEFYFLFFVVSVLFIFMYYLYRMKEMGILRMNGWSSFQISLKILFPMIRNSVIVSLISMTIFWVYVYIMDKSFLVNCFKIYILNILFLLVIFALSIIVQSVLLCYMNQVNAVKNGRNNVCIFYALIFVKLIVLFFVFFETSKIKNDVISLIEMNKVSQQIQSRDLSLIVVPSCNEEDEKKVTQILSEISDKDIYNFGISALNLYSSTEIRNGIERQTINDEFMNIMYLSNNMVANMGIKDANGNLLNDVKIEKNAVCYLIPIWMKEFLNELKETGIIENSSQIIYIENNQVYPHFYWPDSYMYDCIIEVREIEKELFPYCSDVLLSANAVNYFNDKKIENDLSDNIVKTQSLDMDIALSISNAEIELWEALFYLIIILIAYVITSISIVIIYFEFKKKTISVYLLSGQIPFKTISYFCIINEITVITGAILTEKVLMGFVVFELLFYSFVAYLFMRKKAINIVKGE